MIFLNSQQQLDKQFLALIANKITTDLIIFVENNDFTMKH